MSGDSLELKIMGANAWLTFDLCDKLCMRSLLPALYRLVEAEQAKQAKIVTAIRK